MVVEPSHTDGGDDDAEGEDQETDKDHEWIQCQVESGMGVTQHTEGQEKQKRRATHLSVHILGLEQEAFGEYREWQQHQQNEQNPGDGVGYQGGNGTMGSCRQTPRLTLSPVPLRQTPTSFV